MLRDIGRRDKLHLNHNPQVPFVNSTLDTIGPSVLAVVTIPGRSVFAALLPSGLSPVEVPSTASVLREGRYVDDVRLLAARNSHEQLR